MVAADILVVVAVVRQAVVAVGVAVVEAILVVVVLPVAAVVLWGAAHRLRLRAVELPGIPGSSVVTD